MSIKMTRAEREAFLADIRVGILAITDPGRGPLTLPIWYGYQPGGEIWFATDAGTRKGRLLRQGERVSLCVQTETPPYKYVSIEGPVTSITRNDLERDVRPLAHRYLGQKLGDMYIEQTGGGDARNDGILVRVRPERWSTADFGKEFSVNPRVADPGQ